MRHHRPNPAEFLRRAWLPVGLAVAVLAWNAVRGLSFDSLVFVSVVLTVGMAFSLRTLGRQSLFSRVLRVLGGAFGLLLMLTGVALAGLAAWVVVTGNVGPQGFGWIAVMIAIPISIGLIVVGLLPLSFALSSEGRKRGGFDLDAARSSDAVRRFDDLHRPRGPVPPGPPKDPDAEA